MSRTSDGSKRGAGRPGAPITAEGRPVRSVARIAWLGVALVVLMGIAYLSLARAWEPDLPRPLDQLPHAFAYAVLTAVLLAVVLPSTTTLTPWPAAITLGLSLIILGSLLELAQAVVGRDVEGEDAVANAIGVGIALGAWLIVRKMRRRS